MKKKSKSKTAPITKTPANEREPDSATNPLSTHDEYQCENEYHEQCTELFESVMDLADMYSIRPMDMAMCLFNAGQIALGPEACDGCVAAVFKESRRFAAEFFGTADEENGGEPHDET